MSSVVMLVTRLMVTSFRAIDWLASVTVGCLSSVDDVGQVQ